MPMPSSGAVPSSASNRLRTFSMRKPFLSHQRLWTASVTSMCVLGSSRGPKVADNISHLRPGSGPISNISFSSTSQEYSDRLFFSCGLVGLRPPKACMSSSAFSLERWKQVSSPRSPKKSCSFMVRSLLSSVRAVSASVTSAHALSGAASSSACFGAGAVDALLACLGLSVAGLRSSASVRGHGPSDARPLSTATGRVPSVLRSSFSTSLFCFKALSGSAAPARVAGSGTAASAASGPTAPECRRGGVNVAAVGASAA
mmetsp:Transcript_97967/g.173582  ORF Transcript_97967/g.173582 Transcript_97967/m.173582 type:complete len:258 (+) Transcript_97967:147-920(+)